MNVVIMQPYFFPYIGYFQLIAASDIFVLLDDVNFINRGWINRNALCFNGQKSVFTIPLHKASQNRLINEIELSDTFTPWRARFLRSLQSWYGKQLFFGEGVALVEQVLSSGDKKIADINFSATMLLSVQLGLKTRFCRASELGIPKSAGVGRLLAIARYFGADTYVNAPGGKSLYCEEMFIPHGISLKFLKPALHEYPMQQWHPGLSILDAILRMGCANVAEKLLPGWSLERGEENLSRAPGGMEALT